jgi:amino acid transporter
MIPIAGSACTYSYATLGEFVAWFIGWDLLVEYSIGAAAVAVGWSGYAVSFLNQMGIHFPPQLAAFAVVCAAVLVFRYREPDLPRPFKTPWVPVVPLLGIACCLYLALSLPFEAWFRLLFWLIIGLVIYFLYGVRHSRLSLK